MTAQQEKIIQEQGKVIQGARKMVPGCEKMTEQQEKMTKQCEEIIKQHCTAIFPAYTGEKTWSYRFKPRSTPLPPGNSSKTVSEAGRTSKSR